MKIQLDITGLARNSTGTAVFYNSYGRNIARTKPFNYNRPDTPTRQEQESKFQQVVTTLRPYLVFLRTGFSHYSNNSRPWSKAISYNMQNAQFTSDISGKSYISLLSLHFSAGNLQLDTTPPTVDTMPNFLMINHHPTPQELATGSDHYRISFLREFNSPRVHLPEYVTTRENTSVFFNNSLLLPLNTFIYTYFYFSIDGCSGSHNQLIINPF